MMKTVYEVNIVVTKETKVFGTLSESIDFVKKRSGATVDAFIRYMERRDKELKSGSIGQTSDYSIEKKLVTE